MLDIIDCLRYILYKICDAILPYTESEWISCM